jgi:hypothetical protein
MVIAWTRMLCAALLSAAHDLRLNAVLMIKEVRLEFMLSVHVPSVQCKHKVP